MSELVYNMGKIGEMAEFLLRAMVEEGEAEDEDEERQRRRGEEDEFENETKTKGFRC